MKPNIMLDSGAYSAWKSKAVVDLDEYICFIKENMEWIDTYVNLDFIPGEFGRIPSAAEVEHSAELSWNNMLYMEEFDLHPIPVFHMGERFYWLRKMIAHGCPYIGISTANDRTTAQNIVWLDRVFRDIVDENGHAKVKTHAFGQTTPSILSRYPWYSADSASWIFVSATGSIIIPKFRNGKPDYTTTPTTLYMSDTGRAGASQNNDWKHLSASGRKAVVKYLKEYCGGITVQQCITDYYYRTRVCAIYFQNITNASKAGPPTQFFGGMKPIFGEY
jgi:hypothetical protein